MTDGQSAQKGSEGRLNGHRRTHGLADFLLRSGQRPWIAQYPDHRG
jgi:hypothetical protein